MDYILKYFSDRMLFNVFVYMSLAHRYFNAGTCLSGACQLSFLQTKLFLG